ncbi:PRC-barrel domain containing protein [uncultured Sphingomonas sp.]|uniref:PRC-barrel domain containing protein n=1 Tax=uncultured Sphingomonas sp. TaxID=158754 RepID=UPI0035CC9907
MPDRPPAALLTPATCAATLKVKSREGGSVGTLHAFMVHKRSGRATHAVLGLGGLLGMGKSFYPVPIQLLTYDRALDQYVASVDAKVLEGGPNWTSTAPEFDQAYADRVASYYGAEKYELELG